MKNSETMSTKNRMKQLVFYLWTGVAAVFLGASFYNLTGAATYHGNNLLGTSTQVKTAKTDDGHYREEVLARIRAMNTRSWGFGGGSHKKQLALVGIFCKSTHTGRRNLVRQTMLQLAPPGVAVKFVICQPSPPPQSEGRQQQQQQSSRATITTISSSSVVTNPLLWAEMQDHDDLFLMKCDENMNNGKSYQFFREVASHYPGYSFYGKADLDTYILFHNLAILLDKLTEKQNIYVGRTSFSFSQNVTFNGGGLYLLSQDLTRLLQNCTLPACQDVTGHEDVMMGRMLLKLVGPDKLKYADVGVERGDAIKYLGKSSLFVVDPFSIYTHPVKEVDVWWRMHRMLTQKIDLKRLEESFKTNFMDGLWLVSQQTSGNNMLEEVV